MLPFSGDTFDFSLAVTQLCFVSDPCSAVAELVRVTPPGGREWYWPNSAA
jgi:ubiquinone/menaquinone biosynthesis C-methylase UbiE